MLVLLQQCHEVDQSILPVSACSAPFHKGLIEIGSIERSALESES